MAKSGGDTKWLTVALVGLGAIVVGLLVSITILKIYQEQPQPAEQSQSTPQSEVEDTHVEQAVAEEVYALTEELAQLYNSGDTTAALSGYRSHLADALAAEDYDRYFRLLASVSTVMATAQDCAQLMSFYDSLDETELPASQRVYFYGTAAGACQNCNYPERKQLYDSKLQQLYDSGEVIQYED